MERYEFAVIGGGPAGLEAASLAAKAGKRVVLIDRGERVGGAMLNRSTIPSKTLQAVALRGEAAGAIAARDAVIRAHATRQEASLERAGVERLRGSARFVSPHELEVEGERLEAEWVVIATGSRPRTPPWVPKDPARVFDSDTLLARATLPVSLVVLGAGVVACELASIYQGLGLPVVVVNPFGRPPLFGAVEDDLRRAFLDAFRAAGGRYLEGALEEVYLEEDEAVVVLPDEELRADALLVAAPRVANLETLDLAAAGLAPSAQGLLEVDEQHRTALAHVLAVGDVIGPPGLASTGMDQARRALRHALGHAPGSADPIPLGIYTIPEIASVGLGAEAARAEHGDVLIGRAEFADVARAQISRQTEGFLQLVATPSGRLLGVQIVGAAATDLIHLGLLALRAGLTVEEAFLESVFNYPTLAEAYRLAAASLVALAPRMFAGGPTRGGG